MINAMWLPSTDDCANVTTGVRSLRRTSVLAVALLAIGCSAHSGAVPTPSAISPQIFQKQPLIKGGWVLTPLNRLKGMKAFPNGLAVGADHKVWVTVANANGFGALVKIAMDQHQTRFPLTISPGSIALGADQNFWITGSVGGNTGVIARVTPVGTETDFSITAGLYPINIVAGSDGAMWFTECSTDRSSGGIGRMDTSGNYTFYAGVCSTVVTSGPDGNIWFGDIGQNVYSMTTQGTLVGTYPVGDKFGFKGIAAGSDGALYFTGSYAQGVGYELVRVTTSGKVTHLGNDGFGMQYITNGPDGNLWISASLANANRLMTFIPQTAVFGTPIKAVSVGQLIVGPDANIWLADFFGGRVAAYIRLAMTLSAQQLTIPVGKSAPLTVTESNYAGTWTAIATNQAIATVTLNSNNGSFEVTGVAVGTTNVVVYDSAFNSIAVKVTVQ